MPQDKSRRTQNVFGQPKETDLLAAIVESTDDAVLSMTPDGKITSANRGAQRLYGYSEQEFLQMTLSALVPESRWGEDRMLLDRVAGGSRVEHFDTQRRCKDGTFVDVSVTLSPIKDSDGHVIAVSSIARDIGERISQARALQIEADRLAALIEVQDAVIKAPLDVGAIMNLAVDRVQKLTGADGAAVELLEGDEIVYRAGSGIAEAHVGLRSSSDSSLSGEALRTRRVLRSDDAERDPRVDLEACRRIGIRSLVVAPLLHAGEVEGALAIMGREPNAFAAPDEITMHLMAGLVSATIGNAAEYEAKQTLLAERTAAYELERAHADRLGELDRMRTEFVSKVAHELRNPLAAIRGLAYLMVEENISVSEEESRRFNQAIVRQSDHMTKLVDDILLVSQMESDDFTYAQIPLDPALLLNQSVAGARAAYPDRTITLEMPEQLPTLNGDPDRLGQVFSNLIANACNYSEIGSEVNVAAVVKGGSLEVEIRDQGIGISDEHLGMLFKRFSRIPHNEPETAKGTGLGLFISKEIAEAHGGIISVVSTPGSGSTFRVSLPLSR